MDRYLICAAFYIIGSRWHSGQASTGYRKLCQAGKHLRLAESAWRRGSDERAEAARLLWARRREIRASW